jgi:hypothetical protein
MSAKTRVHRPPVVVPGATHEEILAHCQRRGISRPQAYLDLAAGRYEAVKSGRKTLIVVASADTYYASLPKATFKPAKASVTTEQNRVASQVAE